jgi:hypothetical protein
VRQRRKRRILTEAVIMVIFGEAFGQAVERERLGVEEESAERSRS